MPTAVWKVDAVQMLALACAGVAMGTLLRDRIAIFRTLNVPVPILGGLVYSALVLALRDRVVNFEWDITLQNLLMTAFFTTIGLRASWREVRVGGPQVVLLLVLTALGCLLQNGAGSSAAAVFGLHPALGVLAGSVSLAGGPATSLSFGPLFESLGIPAATSVAVASAMFGIAVSGLIGGMVGGFLIGKDRTPGKPMGEDGAAVNAPAPEAAVLFPHLLLIGVAMGLGTLLTAFFVRSGILLPSYIGAMTVAALFRNLDDRVNIFRIQPAWIDLLGNIALSLFVVMALLSLRLWELVHLAGGLLAILVMQTVLVCVMCLGVYRVMGRDYQAAVMAGGFCGFMLGTTANAMACMGALTEKYGPAPRAYLVVPLVGASLLDFVNSAIITQTANLFR